MSTSFVLFHLSAIVILDHQDGALRISKVCPEVPNYEMKGFTKLGPLRYTELSRIMTLVCWQYFSKTALGD